MNTENWKWFRYDEVFDIKHGFYNKKPDNNPLGDIPFIGATDSNNGITSYSDLETIENTTKTGDGNNAPLSEKIFENCLAVTNNGSVGYAYYQEKPFTCTHDVNPLYLKDRELNKYIALFLCTIIEKERFRWAYGRKWRPKRMPSSMIKLPAIKNNNGTYTPNWQYMEDFVKNKIIPIMPQKAKRVWMNNFDKSPLFDICAKLNVSTWQKFRFGDYFEKPYKAIAYSAQDLIMTNPDDKDSLPYVTRTDKNNGVKGYYRKDDTFVIESGNAITLGDTTATIYYQEKDFICGDHIVIVRSKSLNKYVGLFIVTLLNRERYRYNYGRAFLKDMLEDTILKLPAIQNSDGTYTPDWQFMEDYIKSLPYSKNI